MYNVARRPVALGGIWDVIKNVGGKVADVAGDVWGGQGSGDMGVRDVLASGVDAAIDVIRHGTREQVAQVLESNMSGDMRRDLERAYLERRARDLAPLLIVGGLGLVLLLRRR